MLARCTVALAPLLAAAVLLACGQERSEPAPATDTPPVSAPAGSAQPDEASELEALLEQAASLPDEEAAGEAQALDDAPAAAEEPALEEPPPPVAAAPEPERTYRVQPGDTLATIAREQYGDASRYRDLYEANRDQIRDPDVIAPGQVLVIP